MWFLESVSCLVDVAGFVFGVHDLLTPVQTKVSGKHVAESGSQKKIRHAVITEQFKTDYSEVIGQFVTPQNTAVMPTAVQSVGDMPVSVPNRQPKAAPVKKEGTISPPL